jgi:2-amino-4-hydroxy-6-hydroxymethyldihydropteridine diphosphokinase
MIEKNATETAFLALGSNLGDRAYFLRGARQALNAQPGVTVGSCSRLYETGPVGGPPGQNAYLNAVLKVETDLSAHQLLTVCQEVERSFGRRRAERWGARTLDVDLLFFGRQKYCQTDLIVPHPRLHLRSFVLTPLCDVAPDLVHPHLGQTAHDLLAQLPPQDLQCLACHW